VLRRPARGDGAKRKYRNNLQGNTDFAFITDPELNFRFDHELPEIEIPPGGKIKTAIACA